MITKTINGKLYRQLGHSEQRKHGDVFEDGIKWTKFHYSTFESAGHLAVECYRQITRKPSRPRKTYGEIAELAFANCTCGLATKPAFQAAARAVINAYRKRSKR